MGLVFQHGGGAGQDILPNEIFPDNGNDYTGGTNVLLRTAINHAVVRNLYRLRQEAGGYVGYQRLAFCIGQGMELGAVNGIVLADIDVITLFTDGQIGTIRDIGKVLVRGGGKRIGLTKELGLLPGFLGELAGDDVVRNAVAHQVHGHHGKLLAGAALQKEHLVVFRDAHQGAQILLCLVNNLLIGLGTMAHFHNGHAGSLVIQHFCGSFPQNLFRQDRRSRGKIIDSRHIRNSSHFSNSSISL